MAKNFPLRRSFAASHKFRKGVCFICLRDVSEFGFLFDPLVVYYCAVKSPLICVFSCLLPVVVSGFMPLWSENMLDRTSAFPIRGLPWKIFLVHLRGTGIVKFGDGMTYKCLFSRSGLTCHLRPLFPD